MATQDSLIRNMLYDIDGDTLIVIKKLDFLIELEKRRANELMAENRKLRDENTRLRQQIQNGANDEPDENLDLDLKLDLDL